MTAVSKTTVNLPPLNVETLVSFQLPFHLVQDIPGVVTGTFWKEKSSSSIWEKLKRRKANRQESSVNVTCEIKSLDVFFLFLMSYDFLKKKQTGLFDNTREKTVTLVSWKKYCNFRNFFLVGKLYKLKWFPHCLAKYRPAWNVILLCGVQRNDCSIFLLKRKKINMGIFGKRIGSCETAILGEGDIGENLPLTQANFVTF